MPRHLPRLDGLRALAVLLVLWCHVPLVMPEYPQWLRVAHWLVGPGGLGVELFFALSGFLITRILIAERERATPVRWFLLRRVLRIFPIYYLLLLILCWQRPMSEILWCSLYLGNFADVFAATPLPQPSPLGHTWSLCVEEHFYLLWPLVVAFGSPKAGPRVLLWFVMPAAIGSALWVAANYDLPTCQLMVERLSPFRFLTLAAGACLAFAEPRLRTAPAHRVRLLAAGLIAAGLALHPHIWFLWLPLELEAAAWAPLQYSMPLVRVHSALLCTGLVLWTLCPFATADQFRGALATAPLRAIGRISYGLYLYHLPIYHAVLHPAPSPSRTLLALLLTMAAATISYAVIERPILRYGRRFRR